MSFASLLAIRWRRRVAWTVSIVVPELHHPLGYPLALGGMVLVAAGMIWWFRARGWMD